MNREEPSLIGKFYIWYRTEVFPWAKKYRGATRLKKSLEKFITRDLEKAGKPEPISEKEWDNLIILDACRHDLYEEVNGETESRTSAGSMSVEFIEKNFSEGDWTDTVVITANPFYHESRFNRLTGRDVDEVFHSVFHVWESHWNDKEGTTMPEDMKSQALTAEELFPEKKKIIHFMQPHYPFIGHELGAEGYDDILREDENVNIWWQTMRGQIDHNKARKAYKENLEIVMPYVEELGDKMSGQTIVTADHGNLVGEKGLYGHPDNLDIIPLKKVPFHRL